MINPSLVPFQHSNYLSRVFDSPDSYTDLIENAVNTFDTIYKKHKIDAIAFTGISGASIGFTLAYIKDVYPICFRKELSNHALSRIEGPSVQIKNYIIVDDLIDTGNTIKRILDGMYEYGSICRGIMLSQISDSRFDTKIKYKRRNISIFGI